jgi:hypothetical protein
MPVDPAIVERVDKLVREQSRLRQGLDEAPDGKRFDAGD